MKQKRLSAGVRYVVLTLGLTFFFIVLLLLTGLGTSKTQQRIRSNIQASIPQLKNEGTYPQLIDQKDASCRFDNFTEAIILQQCLHMDTAKKPDSVLANRYFTKTYPENSQLSRILSLEETVRSGQTNAAYVRYWIGIRALVRPLLTRFTYTEIRNIMAVIFFVLLLAAAYTMQKYSNLWVSGAFLLTILMMNLTIVSCSLQFAPCFLVMFGAILVLPHARNHEDILTLPMTFFCIGACTQFFDFYTAPVITYAIPVTFLLVMEAGRSTRERCDLATRCLIGWGAGYGMMWIMKLTVSSIVLGGNEFSIAFGQFGKWTGVTQDAQFDRFTASKVFGLLFDVLFSSRNQLLLYAAGLIFVGKLFVDRVRDELNVTRPDWVTLLPAILPLVWIYFARRATGNHYWFQYRQMAALVYPVLVTIVSVFPIPTIPRARPLSEDEKDDIERARYAKKMARKKKQHGAMIDE